MNTKSVGYQSAKERDSVETENILELVSTQDLKSFGIIPELIGRMPVLTYLNPLDEDALRRILLEPNNALIKQYEKLFEMDGITLNILDEAIDFIVEKAVEFKLGARGLRSICEAILTDAMFTLPSDENETKLVVDAQYVQDKLGHLVLKKLKAVS